MRRVAITGLGMISPVGNDREACWNALSAGTSGIGRITRFDAGALEVQLAGEVKGALPLAEPAAQMARHDPKVGFAVAACGEAMRQSGVAMLGPRSLLHVATSLETFDLGKLIHNGKPDFRAVVEKSLEPGAIPLQFPLDLAARLIIGQYGRPGGQLTNCSACAAGAQAIGHAFRAIRAGRYEVALCGGFDSMINPLGVGGFQLLGALTTRNDRGALACRPFDSQRSGTVLGEGSAMVVLEPLEAARANGKTVLAEVAGYGSSLDAHSVSAPDPDGNGAERAMRAAIADAGIAPSDVGHINAHGTGTTLNDAVEAAAIRRVFADTWPRVPVSATKSMTGHLIAAAGAIELGACLLALVRGVLPPNPALEKAGQGCELAHVTKPGCTFLGEYVLSNSFGFGGQNAALVLRRYEQR
jgi:3-oxoacyl-[acyl-carrier-protein] synthase II